MSPATRCQDLGLGAPACMWFTNYTFVSGEPSLPPHMRTYQDLEFNGTKYDWTKVRYLSVIHSSHPHLVLCFNRISDCIFLSLSFPQVIHFQWTKQRVTYSSTFSADAPLAAARLRPGV